MSTYKNRVKTFAKHFKIVFADDVVKYTMRKSNHVYHCSYHQRMGGHLSHNCTLRLGSGNKRKKGKSGKKDPDEDE